MSPADDCADLVRDLMFTANGAYGSYDDWKQRSDLDENPRDPAAGFGRDWNSPELRAVVERAAEVVDECATCGHLHGAHERGCPDSAAAGDAVDAGIDRLKEGP